MANKAVPRGTLKSKGTKMYNDSGMKPSFAFVLCSFVTPSLPLGKAIESLTFLASYQ